MFGLLYLWETFAFARDFCVAGVIFVTWDLLYEAGMQQGTILGLTGRLTISSGFHSSKPWTTGAWITIAIENQFRTPQNLGLLERTLE